VPKLPAPSARAETRRPLFRPKVKCSMTGTIRARLGLFHDTQIDSRFS
jgi:hypothetical protein